MDEATRQVIAEAVAAAVEGAYRQLKENGLTTINERLGSVENGLTAVNERLGSVEKALYQVEERVNEIPLLRQEVNAFLENYR